MSVSKQIIEVIDALCEKFGIVIDYTAENIMPQLELLCEKFIKYEIYTSIFWLAFIGILCIIAWLIYIITFIESKKVEWDEDYWVVTINAGALVVSCILTFIYLFVIGLQIHDIIQANVFPEKTIFEYINTVINDQHL